MKQKTTKPVVGILHRAIFLIILLFTILILPAQAALPADASLNIPQAAMKMVEFNADHQAILDAQSVAALVDYVLQPKPRKETDLPAFSKATGAYYEFDTKISFSDFLQYSYSRQIPSVIKSPSSLRYSLWSTQQGKLQKLPTSWTLASPNSRPEIIRGLERDAITPDLTTGIYYEYDLNRTLIHFNHKGRQALIAVSKQINPSDIGKKGVILGNDDDWNYYYSGEPGSAKSGMGWAKTYIYDYFSVTVYVETGAASGLVRTGVFHWIRAGWSGINFVQPEHVIKGLKRFASNSKYVLESPKLPAPNQIASAYQRFSALPQSDLLEKYTTLQQARLSLAVQSGKIKASKNNNQNFGVGISKEQIVEELMLEYLKIALGKPSLVGKQIILGIN